MSLVFNDTWVKYDSAKGENVPVTQEEYESVILPIAEAYYDNPEEHYDLISDAAEANATVADFAFADVDEFQRLKKRIMEDYWEKCVEIAEDETDYKYIQTGFWED